MKYLFICCLFLFAFMDIACAQNFVTRGKIEFEVKQNIKRLNSTASNANDPYISSLPTFKISYYDMIFSGNRSIYQPGRKGPDASFSQSEAAVYMDLDNAQSIRKFHPIDDYVIMADSINKIKWKIGNETRTIAGWECRKAIGIIYDSVYVVAFYCPEIIPGSGPELFTGLPGMILGLAIPRMYTTWFATKIEIANIDESKIAPPVISKKKQNSKRELAEAILKKYKENGWETKETVQEIMQSLGAYILF